MQTWESYIKGQEDANMGFCFEVAGESGYTTEQAENCDDGDLECPECPWKMLDC